MRQGSLFDDMPSLAGLMPAVRAAMHRAAGQDEEGRKRLVDRINEVASRENLRLTGGNVRAISKDTLDKMLSAGDRDHKPSLEAIAAFCGGHRGCRATGGSAASVRAEAVDPRDGA